MKIDGSFERVIKDNLFWAKSCRFKGQNYEAREL